MVKMNPSTSNTFSVPASPSEAKPEYSPTPSPISQDFQPRQCPHRTRCECVGCVGCMNEIVHWDTLQCHVCFHNCPV
ncbi:hypothetical protein FSARC_12071 [Fusarium sarcochroum]|uniref:Uncharacterized protein n=1 Tax=Fusarium sarcochroum TaxID=1208366 RepID=A0A8H4TB64_9HYPO|nr:hypothetical protein FSARC_12071 [Fusarium sarcochroum]